MCVKGQQDSRVRCCMLCLHQIHPQGLLGSLKVWELEQKAIQDLPAQGWVTLMRGEMHVEVLKETTFSIKIPVKEVIFTPWFWLNWSRVGITLGTGIVLGRCRRRAHRNEARKWGSEQGYVQHARKKTRIWAQHEYTAGKWKNLKLRVGLMSWVTVLAKEEGRKKMYMEEDARYKKSELLPAHSITDVQEMEIWGLIEANQACRASLKSWHNGGSGRAGERWEGQGEISFVGHHEGIVEEMWVTPSMIKWLEKQERNGWWGQHFRQTFPSNSPQK